MIGSYPNKPFAPTQGDDKRWRHTALRRRILQGKWDDDLERELYRHLPADRREAWGAADMSSNALEQVTRQLAMLYYENPSVTHQNDIQDLVGREGFIVQSGLWQLMQRVQQYTIGLRECIVRIDIAQGHIQKTKALSYRVVTPDYVYAEAHPDSPDVIAYFCEYRMRYSSMEKGYVWVADCFDIRDIGNPSFIMYKINQDGSFGDDVTQEYLGQSATGDLYPYRDSENMPFLPLQVYRAEKTGQLWNAFDGSQLTYGTLTSAVLFSFYLHLVRDACWSQKYIAGLQLAGLSALDQDLPARRQAITTDPSSILVFTADPDLTTQPLIGSFEPSADPQKLFESISKYEYRVATAAGISSEVLRQSGDPRSGYALSISREGQREAQRKFAPVFRECDQRLLAVSAKMLNRFLKTSFPEDGYRVQYHTLALSPAEMQATRQDVIEKLNAGLISPVDAIMQLNPDMDDQAARDELIRIRRERAEFT